MDTNTISFQDLFRHTFPEANHFKDFSADCKQLIQVRIQQHAPRGAVISTIDHNTVDMKYAEPYTDQLQTMLKEIVDEIAVKSVNEAVSEADKAFAEELYEANWDKDLK